jgi:protein TonB
MVKIQEVDLKIALLISILCHSVIFLPLGTSFLSLNSAKVNSIEVTYYTKAKSAPVKTESSQKNNITVEKNRAADLLNTESRTEDKTKKVVSVSENKTDEALIKEQEVKSVADSDLKKIRSYMSYYELLKEQIKRHIAYPESLQDGKVYLNFTLEPNGKLRMIRINEQDSSKDVLLRTAALESIKEATPFPPFPEDFPQQEASFNVVISFQIR